MQVGTASGRLASGLPLVAAVVLVATTATTTTTAAATATAAAAAAAVAATAATATTTTAAAAAAVAAAIAAAEAAATAAAATVATATAAAAAEATATSAAAAAATAEVLSRLRLVDAQRATVEFGAIHRLDRLVGVLVGLHLDEREAAATARVAFQHDLDLGNLTPVGAESVAQHVLRGLEGKVAYIQSLTHRVSDDHSTL